MEKQSTLYGIIGLLAGIIIAWAFATSAVNNRNTGMMRMMGMQSSSGMMGDDTDDSDHLSHHGGDASAMSMADMNDNLKNLTGDAFDEQFLATMTAHHQGAIDMAKAAQSQAKHQEIKNMAADIISAQSKEIDQMKTWKEQWRY